MSLPDSPRFWGITGGLGWGASLLALGILDSFSLRGLIIAGISGVLAGFISGYFVSSASLSTLRGPRDVFLSPKFMGIAVGLTVSGFFSTVGVLRHQPSPAMALTIGNLVFFSAAIGGYLGCASTLRRLAKYQQEHEAALQKIEGESGTER